MDAKRIANMAMLVALAIIFSYVEFMIPINPVSYTHLDVYKRQFLCIFICTKGQV